MGKILTYAGLGISGLLLLSGSIWWYLPYVVGEVKNPVAAIYNPSLTKVEKPEFPAYGITHYETFRFRTYDGLSMSAYTVFPEGKIRGTVVALHGYRSNKNRYLPYAEFFTERGYVFIAPDLRGHNESEGDFTGFGGKEWRDTAALIDFIRKKGWLHRPLILYGHSIGGATAIQLQAHEHPADMLILESTFYDLKDLVPNYLKLYFSPLFTHPPDRIVNEVFDRLDLKRNDIFPGYYAKQIHVPVLMIQGGNDKKVPLPEAMKLFKSLGSLHKKLIKIRGAGHTNAIQTAGQYRYVDTIMNFIDKMRQSNFSK